VSPRRVFVVLGALALVPSLAACSSGKVKISSKSLCENAGGRYADFTCQPGSTRGAGSMCEAHGGVYLAGEDNCIIFEK
jgi:hypothetical protein